MVYRGYKVDLSWIKGKAREVLSKAIQEKAFKSGYRWCEGCVIYLYVARPYLYFNEESKYITYGDSMSIFETGDSEAKEISVNNWLEGNIIDLKPAYTPKMGDAVLVRDSCIGLWQTGVFFKMQNSLYCTYKTSWVFCIPFDAGLVNTSKEPE